MPAPPPAAPLAAPLAARPDASPDLLRLRSDLDGMDDALHDLLLRRAAIVGEVAKLGQKGRVALRPGREAAILRRLLARHTGALPPAAVVQVWREIFHGTTSLQGAYSLAVCDPDPAGGLATLARAHFGALIPLRTYHTAAQAIGEVSAGSATAAVLPLPADDEPASAAWWTALLQRDDPRIHVVARLPFWAARTEGAPRPGALVVTTVPPDPSGQDRTLLGMEVAPDQSRARLGQAFASAGLDVGRFILRRDGGSALLLVDVAGFVQDGDAQVMALAAPGTLGGAVQGAKRAPVVLGAYALPVGGELQQ